MITPGSLAAVAAGADLSEAVTDASEGAWAVTDVDAADGVGIAEGTFGSVSGASLLRSGMSMGVSTAIGRGCLSNKSGNPTTPINTNTVAPTKRYLARWRMASMLCGWGGALVGSSAALRNLKKAMQDQSVKIRKNQAEGKCLACRRGIPSLTTPPTV